MSARDDVPRSAIPYEWPRHPAATGWQLRAYHRTFCTVCTRWDCAP